VKIIKRSLSWILPIVIGLGLGMLVRQFWFTMVRVDGRSMQPNLQNNERVVAFKTGQIKAGSVVVFDAHGVSPDATTPNTVYVKRVIGMPGDTVTYTKTGQLYVNHRLIKQTYLKSSFQQTTGTYMANSHGQVTGWTLTSLAHDQPDWQLSAKPKNNRVPKGHYFVMGDHRSVSSDGRYWGFVPQRKMIGVVKAWPWQNRRQAINAYQP